MCFKNGKRKKKKTNHFNNKKINVIQSIFFFHFVSCKNNAPKKRKIKGTKEITKEKKKEECRRKEKEMERKWNENRRKKSK